MKLTTRLVAALSLMGFAVAGLPALASAKSPKQSPPPPAADGRATLYELTENMKVVQRNKRKMSLSRRIATSALSGLASPGSPLCPIFDPPSGGEQPPCVVNVQGMDNISLLTGLGTFQGTFATVMQGDNPVDGPEAVVLRGEFGGQMNFAPAILHQIPFGTVVGKVSADRGRKTDFTGIFRLPFDGSVTTEVEVAPGVKVTLTLRQLFCAATPKQNPNTELFPKLYKGLDLAYLDNVEAVMTPEGRCFDVEPDELSLGMPLVRFDIDF